MKSLKKYSIFFLKLLALLLIGVLLGTILMIAVYTIPTEHMEKNLMESANIFKMEGDYPNFYEPPLNFNAKRDNFTDGIMLLIATHSNGSESIVNSAMLNKSYYINTELSPSENITEHYLQSKEFEGERSYGRYWHGYLLYLKPLLFFLSYGRIRYLNHFFQLFLFIIITFLFYKKKLLRYEIPYIISLLTIMPFAIVLNLQLSCCYTILKMGIIFILLFSQKLGNKSHYIFLYLGIATAFFDFLTYPVATFGVPAIIYFCLVDEKGNLKQTFLQFLKIGFVWIFGYSGMWVSKWIIATLLTGKNIIDDGINNVVKRTSGNESEIYTASNSILKNISDFFDFQVVLIVCVFTIIMTFLIIRLISKNKKVSNEIWNTLFPFLGIAIIPFLWYGLVKNHSIIHTDLLSDKILVVTVMAWTTMLVKIYYVLKSKSIENINEKQIS